MFPDTRRDRLAKTGAFTTPFFVHGLHQVNRLTQLGSVSCCVPRRLSRLDTFPRVLFPT